MKNSTSVFTLGASALLALCAAFSPRAVRAGQEIAAAPGGWAYEPLRGELTLGIGGTRNSLNGSADLTVPLWKGADQNDMLFLDGYWTGDSAHDEAYSAGLGFRHRFAGTDLIAGVNAFWDHGIFQGQSFDQFGTGVELLSHWVDFRANGYFPNDNEPVLTRSSSSRTFSSASSVFAQSQSSQTTNLGFQTVTVTTNTTTKTTTTTNRKQTRFFERRERAMPGFDTELGFLIPGLDRYLEARVFGGYTYFQGGYESNISTGTARLEARVLPALIFDSEYKGDDRLLDGRNHWFWGMRAEIPFDLGNLCQGRSPFDGITAAFTPKWISSSSGYAGPTGDDKKVVANPELERNRMNENIIRSWRPQIDYSGPIPSGTENTKRVNIDQTETKTQTTNTVFNPQ